MNAARLAFNYHGASGLMRTKAAFTLLEIVIVLAIMALLMGIAVMNFDSVTREGEMRRPVSELQSMTQEAVQRAGLYEKPQIIVFDSKGFTMRYKSDIDGKTDKNDDALWQRRVTLPTEMKIFIRRFGSTKFIPATGQRLVIASGGLCEPLTVRFELGKSWIEISLDPLSGGVRDEAMNIQ